MRISWVPPVLLVHSGCSDAAGSRDDLRPRRVRMRKLWTMAAVMVAVSFLGLSFASAEDGPKKEHKRPPIAEIFKKISGDDGKICIEDLKKNPRTKDKAAEILKKWDTDENGTVCIEEFTAGIKKHHAEHHKGEHKRGEHKKGEGKKGEGKKSTPKKCDKDAPKKCDKKD